MEASVRNPVTLTVSHNDLGSNPAVSSRYDIKVLVLWISLEDPHFDFDIN
jgi:hypothetical protein